MEIGLDTNCVIDLLNGKIDATAFREKYTNIYLPVTVLGELVFGAKNSSRSEQNLKKITDFASHCYVIPIDEEVAFEYAACRKKLFNNGTPIPENDIWIAAACIKKGIAVATRDAHFDKIEGLTIVTIKQTN